MKKYSKLFKVGDVWANREGKPELQVLKVNKKKDKLTIVSYVEIGSQWFACVNSKIPCKDVAYTLRQGNAIQVAGKKSYLRRFKIESFE